MNEYKFADCVIGLKESFDVTIKEEMLDAFRDLSGDVNPLHNDAEFAKGKGFPGRVCYGMLTASFLSTLAGVYLPGKYCLIQQVELKFAKPVMIGDQLTVTGEVIERNDTVQRIVIAVTIMNNTTGKKVLRGKMYLGVLDPKD